MATFPEARAKKAERQRREARYYSDRARRGPRCRVCREPMDAFASAADGLDTHPMCGPYEEPRRTEDVPLIGASS